MSYVNHFIGPNNWTRNFSLLTFNFCNPYTYIQECRRLSECVYVQSNASIYDQQIELEEALHQVMEKRIYLTTTIEDRYVRARMHMNVGTCECGFA